MGLEDTSGVLKKCLEPAVLNFWVPKMLIRLVLLLKNEHKLFAEKRNSSRVLAYSFINLNSKSLQGRDTGRDVIPRSHH